jgi:hypothetical protein
MSTNMKRREFVMLVGGVAITWISRARAITRRPRTLL